MLMHHLTKIHRDEKPIFAALDQQRDHDSQTGDDPKRTAPIHHGQQQGDSWSNTGTIEIAGGTLGLNMDVTTAALGSITVSNGAFTATLPPRSLVTYDIRS